MVKFGSLAVEIGSLVWGIPAHFNGFRILASLLQRRRSVDANQSLHDVLSFPGELFHWALARFKILVLSYIRSVTARHSSSERQPNYAALSRGRQLYSAGRPNVCWALTQVQLDSAVKVNAEKIPPPCQPILRQKLLSVLTIW